MKKKVLVSLFVLFSTIVLAGCQMLDSMMSDVEESITGLSGTIQTYDEESNIIDQVKAKSIAFSANSEFVKTDSNGESSGSVLEATVGGNQMIHVGSTLLFYEDGLYNVFDDYAKTIDLENRDRSIPIVNQMVNNFENKFIGTAKVILVRSQSGKPLATFAGDKVSVEAMEVEKMSKITIDGKRIYIYRADYTIYDTKLLKK